MSSSAGPARATAPADPAVPGSAVALDVVLYDYREDKAPLLREVVLPLARRAAAEGLAAHVERHWLYGPHVRLRLRGTSGAVAAAAERAAATLRGWAAGHPSAARVDEEELLARAAVAGRAELIAPPYGPLVPDGTVRVEPVDQSSLRALIGSDGARLRDDLLALGLPALETGCAFLTGHGAAPAARVQLAVAALAAHAAAHPQGLVGGHYSFVSHLEDFLVYEDEEGACGRPSNAGGRPPDRPSPPWSDGSRAAGRRAGNAPGPTGPPRRGASRRSGSPRARTSPETPWSTGTGRRRSATGRWPSAGIRTYAPATASSTAGCAARTPRAGCGAGPTT